MILLIDAYNVLKQATPSVEISERERATFIQQLGRYAKLRHHKIVLVFDGGPYDRSSQERRSGIYVVYSGALETADDYIKRYLQKHKILDLLLISSDRELRSAAARYAIESMRSQEFYRIMLDALNEHQSEKAVRQTLAQKTAEGDNPELDRIMQEGSKVVPRKVEDFVAPQEKKKSKAHKPSKKERKTLKKLKKL